MKNAFDYFIYLLFRLFVGGLRILPLLFVYHTGRLLGFGAYVLLPSYRRLVLGNLVIAFGREKSPAELALLARQHFTTLGANLLCSVKVSRMDRQEILNIAEIENIAFFEEAQQDPRGAVLVISHQGNWEMIAQIAVFLPGLNGATIYQALGNKYIDHFVTSSRERFGVGTFERSKGFDAPIRLLREGGVIAVLVDQHAGDKGIWTPLFGRLASTSPLAAMLATRTGSILLPLAIHTTGHGRWKVVIDKPVEPASKNIEVVTDQINTILENQIRRSPKDWFWVHDRWKTPQPKLLLQGYRRGIHIPAGTTPADLQRFPIVIRSSNWLGDAVMTLPAVRAIKQGRPDIVVTILCKAKLADFWSLVPEVDEILTIDPEDGIFAVAAKLRGKFEAGILLPNSVRTALELWLAGVPRRIGYRSRWRRLLLNQIVQPPKKAIRPRHQVHHYLRIAEWLGADIGNESVAVRQQPPIDGDGSLRIGLCPGAEYGPAKRWMAESFAAAASEVARRRDVEWVLFGTKNEADLGEEIENGIEGGCLNLIGKTTLLELADELSTCKLLVTNDTGTMHLAGMLDVPVLAIFGSTEPKLTGPLGSRHTVIRHQVACSPCFLRNCPLDFRCMKAVEVDEVVEGILRKL